MVDARSRLDQKLCSAFLAIMGSTCHVERSVSPRVYQIDLRMRFKQRLSGGEAAVNGSKHER